jgi:ribosomal protein S18 acetylase RimI-like enzyme
MAEIQGDITELGGSLFALLPHYRVAVLDTTAMHLGLYIARINVPKGHRNNGVGSELMAELKRQAAVAGHTRLIVEPGGYSHDDHGARLRFYERHGFSQHPEESYYLLDIST